MSIYSNFGWNNLHKSDKRPTFPVCAPHKIYIVICSPSGTYFWFYIKTRLFFTHFVPFFYGWSIDSVSGIFQGDETLCSTRMWIFFVGRLGFDFLWGRDVQASQLNGSEVRKKKKKEVNHGGAYYGVKFNFVGIPMNDCSKSDFYRENMARFSFGNDCCLDV